LLCRLETNQEQSVSPPSPAKSSRTLWLSPDARRLPILEASPAHYFATAAHLSGESPPWNIALMNKELAVRATWSGTHGLPSVGLGGCGGSKGSMIVHGSSLASSPHGAESNISGGF
jgi:hypothetical protein